MEIDKTEIENRIAEKLKEGEKKFGKEFKFLLLEILGLERMITPASAPEEPKERLIPLAKWNDYHDFPTVSALRQYKFRMEINGFKEVIEFGGENGNTILIKENKFFKWYTNHTKNCSI